MENKADRETCRNIAGPFTSFKCSECSTIIEYCEGVFFDKENCENCFFDFVFKFCPECGRKVIKDDQ